MTPRLLCMYGHGSAGPWDIVRSVEPLAELAVVIETDDAQSRRAAQVFQTLDVPVYGTAEAARAGFGAFNGVVTYSELCVISAAGAAERWQLPGMTRRTAETLRSKLAQRQRLAEAGCDDVPFRSARTASEVRAAVSALGMPAVIKPDRGWGSRDARRISNPSELSAALKAIDADEPGGYIVESYLRGREESPFGDYVSVEVLMAGGEPVVLAVTGKLPLIPPFREPGQFWPSHLIPKERSAICDFVLHAVSSLEIEVGALHVEVKLCEDGPHIIEVNGRVGGFVPEMLESGASIDLIGLAAQAALGASMPTALDERRPSPPQRVRVQYSSLLPPGAIELIAAPTAKALACRDEVDFYRVIASPDTDLRRGVATQELDLIQAVADDHDAMFSTLERLQREIVLTMRLDNGTVASMTAKEVAARNGSG